MTENQNETLILEYLEKRSPVALKVPSVGYFDAKVGRYRKQVSKFVRKGISDVFYLEGGEFYVFEVKSDTEHKYIKKHLDDIMKSHGIGLNKKRMHIYEQALFIEDVKREGGFGGFVSTVEDVMEIINGSKKGLKL